MEIWGLKFKMTMGNMRMSNETNLLSTHHITCRVPTNARAPARPGEDATKAVPVLACFTSPMRSNTCLAPHVSLPLQVSNNEAE